MTAQPAGTTVKHGHWWTRPAVVTVAAATLLAGAGSAYGVDRHIQEVHRQVVAAAAAHTAAVVQLSDERTQYESTLASAKEALEGVSAKDVSDPATVQAVQQAVSDADDLLAQAHSATAPLPPGTSRAQLDQQTASAVALQGKLSTAATTLNGALKAMSQSHAAFTLQAAKAAFDAAAGNLTAQVTAAQAVLDESAGKVDDDAVRAALQASMGQAMTVAAAKGATAEQVTAATNAVGAAAADLSDRVQAVTAAQEAWTAAHASPPPAPAARTAVSGSTRTSTARAGTTTSAQAPAGTTGTSPTTGASPAGGAPQVTNQTRATSTPAQAIAGLTSARAGAGLQTVTSCDQVPGSAMGGVGIVHAIAWEEFLTSPDHRAIVMVPRAAVLQAWNATDSLGDPSIYVKVSACIVPS